MLSVFLQFLLNFLSSVHFAWRDSSLSWKKFVFQMKCCLEKFAICKDGESQTDNLVVRDFHLASNCTVRLESMQLKMFLKQTKEHLQTESKTPEHHQAPKQNDLKI